MAIAIVSRSGVSAASSRVSALSAAVAAFLAIPSSLNALSRLARRKKLPLPYVNGLDLRGSDAPLSTGPPDRPVLRLAFLQRNHPLQVFICRIGGRRRSIAGAVCAQQPERLL